MSHIMIKKSFYLAVKFVVLSLVAAAVIIWVNIGNIFIRSMVVAAIVCGSYIRKRKKIHSRTYNEVGYWSGLDDFDIGIFDCFDDEDFADIFDEQDQETKSAY